METSLSDQQKIERLETEKRQLENRIKQLKHAAHTAERKRLTRAARLSLAHSCFGNTS